MPSATQPFLDVSSFTHPPQQSPSTSAVPMLTASPFRAVYEMEEEAGNDPLASQRLAFIGELEDEEFERAVFEVAAEASALHDMEGEVDGSPMVRQQFSSLQRELERGIDAAAKQFAHTELREADQKEVEAFFEGYNPQQEMGPAFENLFGGIWKKLKKAASGAVKLATSGLSNLANLALGPLLSKLKPLVPMFLTQVLRYARDKVPKAFQPALTQLAQRFGVKMETAEGEDEASPGIDELENEFDGQLAEVVFAPGEVERNLEVARQELDSARPQPHPIEDLDRARAELADRLSRLKEGEEAAPAFENFIPALLPVLGLGIRMIGRPRVVGFLAKLLSGLLGRLIGPLGTPALSQAIVDAGLKLLHLEATPETAETAARSAVISTVEDTVRRVTALPDYMLEDQELLEGAALEAFEAAAAANLPPVLSQETYRARPELRESGTFPGMWIPYPIYRHGLHRHHHPPYKKFSRVLRVRMTPEKAGAVETFGGSTLAEFLEEQMGLAPGAEFEGNVHLYEALPGAMLPDITRMEQETPGLGSATEAAYGQLHPLTPMAAGLVLGDPGLGRHASPAHLFTRRHVGAGQRFYHLSIPGVRPPAKSGGPRPFTSAQPDQGDSRFDEGRDPGADLPGRSEGAETAGEAAAEGARRCGSGGDAANAGKEAGAGVNASPSRRGEGDSSEVHAAAGERRRSPQVSRGAAARAPRTPSALDSDGAQGYVRESGTAGAVGDRGPARRRAVHDHVPRAAGRGGAARCVDGPRDPGRGYGVPGRASGGRCEDHSGSRACLTELKFCGRS